MIERGRIRLLFRTGSYDGMAQGVGVLDGSYIYLDASERMGGRVLRARWWDLQNLLEELLDDDDADNIWDRIERKYDEQMHEDTTRRFQVRALTKEQFARFAERHRQFQLHVGLHCDYVYDDQGRPRDRERYWGNSTEYHKAHYWDPVPPSRPDSEENLPLLGYIESKDLYAPSGFRGGDVSAVKPRA